MAQEDLEVRESILQRSSLGLSGNVQFREYLEAHGYDTTQMGLRSETDTMSSTSDVQEKKEPITV